MQNFLKSRVVHGAAGFVLMGSWAAIANAKHPWPAPAVAGVVQGASTVMITLLLKRMIEAIHGHATGKARWYLPPLAAFGTSACVLSLIHLAAGTPALLLTIALPVSVSTGYAVLYTAVLEAHPD